MALRKLAGPFNIVDENGNPPALIGTPCCYQPYMGVVLKCTTPNWVTGGTNEGVLALDGVVNQFTNLGDPGSYGWDVVNRAVLTIIGGNEYIRDGRAFLAFQVEASVSGVPNGYAKLLDRRLKLNGATVYAIVAGVATAECSDVGIAEFGPGMVGAGRNDHEVLLWQAGLVSGNLLCRFYDTALKAVSSPVCYIPMASGSSFFVSFAPDLGVLLVLDFDNMQLSVWSLDVLPAAVSDPAVWQGAVREGDIATMRVSILGDDGEPCTGELVDWAVSGAGSLLDQQSEVDSQGYAVARVFYSLTDSGDSTVTASVAC